MYIYLQLPFLILISVENLKSIFLVIIGSLLLVTKVSCLQHSAIQNIKESILKQTVDPRNRTKENIDQREAVFLLCFFCLVFFVNNRFR